VLQSADQLVDCLADLQVAALKQSSVVVMYASAYGNTAALAQAISRGVTKGGVAVNTVNLELSSLEEVLAAVLHHRQPNPRGSHAHACTGEAAPHQTAVDVASFASLEWSWIDWWLQEICPRPLSCG